MPLLLTGLHLLCKHKETWTALVRRPHYFGLDYLLGHSTPFSWRELNREASADRLFRVQVSIGGRHVAQSKTLCLVGFTCASFLDFNGFDNAVVALCDAYQEDPEHVNIVHSCKKLLWALLAVEDLPSG